jgi:hypothetical protein
MPKRRLEREARRELLRSCLREAKGWKRDAEFFHREASHLAQLGRHFKWYEEEARIELVARVASSAGNLIVAGQILPDEGIARAPHSDGDSVSDLRRGHARLELTLLLCRSGRCCLCTRRGFIWSRQGSRHVRGMWPHVVRMCCMWMEIGVLDCFVADGLPPQLVAPEPASSSACLSFGLC